MFIMILIMIVMAVWVGSCIRITIDFCNGGSTENANPNSFIFNRYEIFFLGSLTIFIFLLVLNNISDDHLANEAMHL
jgi:hypothetical protein